MKVAVGSDHGGFILKQEILQFLVAEGHEVVDAGCFSQESVDYPAVAAEVCNLVSANNVARGIIICGTGIGVSMAANRFAQIRAALCHEAFTARMSREHNDANVLCLGERVLGVAIALDIVSTWLETEFAGGRHLRRIQLIK